jgi:type I restriction enzyme, S subunit
MNLRRPWPNISLGELCEVNIGRTPARNRSDFWGKGFAWLSIADMNNGRDLQTTKETITELAIRECNCRPVEPGTVLVSFKLSIGKVGIAQTRLYTNEAIASLPIRDQTLLSTKYLYWVLQAIDLTLGLDRAAKGLTLNKAKLLDIKIPLPSLAEQRRIAEILDRAEALRAKRRAALAQLDSLTKSIFLDVIGQPARKGWAETDIEGVSHPKDGSIRTGPFGSQLLHNEFVNEGIAVLGIDNAVANEFRWSGRRFITEAKYRQLKRYTVRPGDVLITIMGTCGRCAVVPDDIPLAVNTKHLCCITLDQSKCLPVYLHAYFLQHPVAQKYLNQTAKGAIMSGLNMGIIKQMPILLPPMDHQREFARRVAAVEKLKAVQRASLEELNTLFASLQHRAFRGEL